MAEYQTTTPNSRPDFVKFLKVNDNNISQTIVKLEEHLELDDQKKDSLHGILFRLLDVVKRSKNQLILYKENGGIHLCIQIQN